MRISGELAKAVHKGDAHAVKAYFGGDPEPHPKFVHPYVHKALIIACKLGRKPIAEILLDLGAVIEARDKIGKGAPLRRACSRGDSTMIHWLIDRGATVDAGALNWAAARRHRIAVATLLARHTFPSSDLNNALIHAAGGGCVLTMNLLLLQGAGVGTDSNRPLFAAVQYNRTAAAKMLLNRGADIHAREDFAIMFAALLDHSKMVTQLLAHGADRMAALHGELLRHAKSGNIGAIHSLLQRGVNIHGRHDQALRLALEQSPQIVGDLVDIGDYRIVNPNLALIAFASIGNHREVARLIGMGADFCSEEHTALHLCVKNGHIPVIDILMAHYDIDKFRQATAEMCDDDLQLVRARLRQMKARAAINDTGMEI